MWVVVCALRWSASVMWGVSEAEAEEEEEEEEGGILRSSSKVFWASGSSENPNGSIPTRRSNMMERWVSEEGTQKKCWWFFVCHWKDGSQHSMMNYNVINVCNRWTNHYKLWNDDVLPVLKKWRASLHHSTLYGRPSFLFASRMMS